MKDKINCLQFCSMFILIVYGSFLGIGVFSIVKAAGINAYLSILIAMILGIPLLLIFIYLFNYEPDLPLPEKIKKLCGKKIGFVINFGLLIIVALMGVNLMYNLVNFIVSQFLPETPTFFVGFMFLIVIGYANSKGIETISRVCFILLLLVLILFSTAFFGLYPNFDMSNLKPFLEFGVERPLIGALYFIALNLDPILMLLMIPKNKIADNKNFKKMISVTYIISILLLFFVVFFTLGNLGIYLASIYQYPEYIVLKRINLFNFLDRIENIITTQWIFALFGSLCFIVYYIKNVFKYENKSKTLPYLIPLLLLVCAHFFFPNNTAFNSFTYHVPPYVRMGFGLTCFILCIIVFVKRKLKKE